MFVDLYMFNLKYSSEHKKQKFLFSRTRNKRGVDHMFNAQIKDLKKYFKIKKDTETRYLKFLKDNHVLLYLTTQTSCG